MMPLHGDTFAGDITAASTDLTIYGTTHWLIISRFAYSPNFIAARFRRVDGIERDTRSANRNDEARCRLYYRRLRLKLRYEYRGDDKERDASGTAQFRESGATSAATFAVSLRSGAYYAVRRIYFSIYRMFLIAGLMLGGCTLGARVCACRSRNVIFANIGFAGMMRQTQVIMPFDISSDFGCARRR
jgi:hypothetical protein